MDRIEAGSISASKLADNVGAVIDLSDNSTIKMVVEKSGVHKGTTPPSSPEIDTLWLDTSTTTDVQKRWTGNEWVETTLAQSEKDFIYQSLEESRVEVSYLSNEIKQKVSSTQYVTEMGNKADASYVEQQLATMITQTDSKIEYQFEQSKTYVTEATDPLNKFKEQVQSYQRFTADGLELGASNSPFIAKLGNTKLSFLQDGVEVAYISNNKQHVTEARVTERLSIGTEENGYFDWITTNKGLALKWRG